MKIPEKVKKAIAVQDLHLVATASREGKPNLIYVKFLKIYNEEKLMVANNKFFKTEKNLLENPKMAGVVLDKETGKAYQLKGSVEIHKKGNVFELFSRVKLEPKKRNRYYKKDTNGYYYIPELKFLQDKILCRTEISFPR